MAKTTIQSNDRRRHHRVGVRLLGRYMLPDQNEYHCQVINISPGGLALSSPTCGEIGDRVVLYLDHVGRVEGVITRHFAGGFACLLKVPDRKRERLADQLTWLANRSILTGQDGRVHERIVPTDSSSVLSLPDGRNVSCTILDISVSGASISTPVFPEIGTEVVLGRTRGRVVRHHDDGVAIRFTGAPDLAKLSGHFLPARMSA